MPGFLDIVTRNRESCNHCAWTLPFRVNGPCSIAYIHDDLKFNPPTRKRDSSSKVLKIKVAIIVFCDVGMYSYRNLPLL